MKKTAIAIAFGLAVFATAPDARAQKVLKEEPTMGALRRNERVLVDNGVCPKGQILEVIGGDHTKVGGTKQVERQKRCIPH